MKMLRSIFARYSSHARARRGNLLRKHVELRPSDRVLDLGGGDGRHFHSLYPDQVNVTIADIDPDDLSRARSHFGYATFLLGEDAVSLPFKDQEFDFLFCSSVIEHVTGPKKDVWLSNGRAFEASANEHQCHFSAEIRRISKQYYVQTPYRYFLIESHSWLPGVVVLLPREWLVPLIRFTNKFWPKKTSPDWRLLTISEFRSLFPDAEIHYERSLGLVKSLMAIKTTPRRGAERNST